MPTSLRRRLRLARRGLWYFTAVSLVLLALGAGIVSQLLPLAERHPDRIAEWLSARAGRPVQFDKVQTAWTRRGPLLRLDGLRVGAGKDAVAIGAAEILVSQYAGLLPGRSFTEVRVRNLALTLERADDGRWQVRGLPGQSQGADPLSALEGLGELQVIDARLGISAPSLKIETVIPDVDLRLQVDGERVRSGLRARSRRDGSPVDFVLDFDRASGNGRLYASAKNADLSSWSSLLHVNGVTIAEGRGRAEVWASLRRNRIASISVDGDLKDVRLRGAPFAAMPARVDGKAKEAAPFATFARLQAVAHWRAEADGWRLDAPSMQVHAQTDSKPQILDGLVLAGGKRYGLRAERIDAGPLFAVLALSDRLDPKLRRWLTAAKPGAVLERVSVGGLRGGVDSGAADGGLRIEATVRDLQFAAIGDSPGIEGLSGDLRGDAEAVAFAFDPKAKLRFDWPRGFGVVHVVGLRGEAIGWREGAGWRVETPALRIDGDGYGADLRGGLWFQGDGTAPRIDIAADLDDALAPTAKRFWPKHVMSPALVHWLDTALLSGHVRDGRAVIAGELENWPFKSPVGAVPTGVFDARATLQDMRVKFNADWPATSDMDADIAFIGNGFSVAGKAVLAEVGIREFQAGIPDYGNGALGIDAHADADAAKLLGLVRQSPLRKDHAGVLTSLGASGPASVGFTLALPLHGPPSQKPKIDGEIELRGVRLSESEWKLAFAGVNGRARYDENGFSANDLRAQYDRQDGRLSLRAGPGHVRDKRQGFEAELEASLTSDDLLERASDLAWLKPFVRGRSRWTAGIAIPVGAAASASTKTPALTRTPVAQITRLQLRSDLVGMALDLPAPMDKAAGTALPTTLDLQLPIGKGEIALAFGQRFALRAKDTQGQLGIRAAFGTDRIAEAPPTTGLVIGGRAATLDAIGWVALTKGNGGSRLPLRRADVTADRLLLLGAAFPDTRLQIAPASGGLGAQLDGAALAGALLIPETDGGSIAGRLQRLHWRSAGAAVATSASTATITPVSGEIDPSKVPAINLRVDDLRIAGAALGDTQFRSRPTAAGMEIVQLQTRAPKRRIDVTGDWSGRGAATRTHLNATLVSDDFGALLTDFGIGGRLDSGKGDARFDASWAGSPMAFQLGALDGTLVVNVKDGRLVEIEPGGTGRVLGLLSIAQLPRRLTLDFRDFFSKGFAFNKLGGTVKFSGGSARSEDFAINGPAASINIRGAANMRTQTFDQTIEVLPKTGNLLTAVGAIAGGPVGAAVGAVANAVLQKPLGQAAAKNYRVTGPWKDPKVEVVERSSTSARPAPGAG